MLRMLSSTECLQYDGLDSDPGVHPLACCEICTCLISKYVVEGEAIIIVQKACRNVQLCASLYAGIDGNFHVVREGMVRIGNIDIYAGTDKNPTPQYFVSCVDEEIC